MTQSHSREIENRIEAKLRNVGRPASAKQLAVWMNIPDDVIYQALIRLQQAGVVTPKSDAGRKTLMWKVKGPEDAI